MAFLKTSLYPASNPIPNGGAAIPFQRSAALPQYSAICIASGFSARSVLVRSCAKNHPPFQSICVTSSNRKPSRWHSESRNFPLSMRN